MKRISRLASGFLGSRGDLVVTYQGTAPTPTVHTSGYAFSINKLIASEFTDHLIFLTTLPIHYISGWFVYTRSILMRLQALRPLAPLLAALLLPVTFSLPAGADQAINVGGTTNLAPLVAKAASDYQSSHAGITISVKGSSSGAGIAALKDHSSRRRDV